MDKLMPSASALFRSLLSLAAFVIVAEAVRAGARACLRSLAEDPAEDRVDAYPEPPATGAVVLALVSETRMEQRLRAALGPYARLCFAATWVELQQIMRFVVPSAIFADPMADAVDNLEGRFAQLCSTLQGPVILYTTLTPRSATALLSLGQTGIRDVVFCRCDDSRKRLVNTLMRAQPWPH